MKRKRLSVVAHTPDGLKTFYRGYNEQVAHAHIREMRGIPQLAGCLIELTDKNPARLPQRINPLRIDQAAILRGLEFAYHHTIAIR